MAETLEMVLADERGQAAVLRHNGHPQAADLIERICARVAAAAEDFTRWLSESDAGLKSGHPVPWFRARYPAWLADGNARPDPLNPRRRQYRAIIVPQRGNASSAYEAGKRAGRGESAA